MFFGIQSRAGDIDGAGKLAQNPTHFAYNGTMEFLGTVMALPDLLAQTGVSTAGALSSPVQSRAYNVMKWMATNDSFGTQELTLRSRGTPAAPLPISDGAVSSGVVANIWQQDHVAYWNGRWVWVEGMQTYVGATTTQGGNVFVSASYALNQTAYRETSLGVLEQSYVTYTFGDAVDGDGLYPNNFAAPLPDGWQPTLGTPSFPWSGLYLDWGYDTGTTPFVVKRLPATTAGTKALCIDSGTGQVSVAAGSLGCFTSALTFMGPTSFSAINGRPLVSSASGVLSFAPRLSTSIVVSWGTLTVTGRVLTSTGTC